jgi:HSP20 family protein
MNKENNKKDVSVRSEDKNMRPTILEDRSPRDLFSRFFDDDTWLEPFGSFRIPRLLRRIDYRLFPRVDVSETDKEVKVVADVPGVDPENINIDVRDNRITISGRTEREMETDKSAKPYRYERSYGEFRREFVLPSYVKEDQVKATYKDGVLTVTLPKVEGEKRNKIKIEKQ